MLICISFFFFPPSVSHSQITRLYSRFTSLDKGENGTLRWVSTNSAVLALMYYISVMVALPLQDACMFSS